MIAKIFEEEINIVVKGVLRRQPTKKKNLRCLAIQYKKKKRYKISFQKGWCAIGKQFMQDLVLLVVKNYLLFNLGIEHGWNILQCIYVLQELSFLKIKLFSEKVFMFNPKKC